jgi:hypothetical protein
MENKPCPFCGHKVDLEEPDTVHPSGLYYRVSDGIKHYVRFSDRKEGDSPCWVMNCGEIAGGCGVEIHGDSKEEVLGKWDRRTT